jgi:hypothetical protein
MTHCRLCSDCVARCQLMGKENIHNSRGNLEMRCRHDKNLTCVT